MERLFSASVLRTSISINPELSSSRSVWHFPTAASASNPRYQDLSALVRNYIAWLKDKLHLSSRRKAQLRTACSGLKSVLETAKVVADNAGVPGLSMGMSGLIYVLDVAEKMGQNAEDIEALSVRMNNLIVMLKSVSPVKTRPKEVTERFEKLGRTLVVYQEKSRSANPAGSLSTF
ncbi:hypothetical protein B0H14DRAFT_3150882 [Mycena olivaceomarginata]|nr:hypothetical protein B0H14DRAFT_3150882 [Mycena olivaceomarginata]